MYRLPQWKLDKIKARVDAFRSSKKDLETIAAMIEIEFQVPAFHTNGHLYLEPSKDRTRTIKLF